jgi:hypothetical protein
MNVEFHAVQRIYIFWRAIKVIQAEESLWGDYGRTYWQHGEDAAPGICKLLQPLLQGRSSALPFEIFDDVEAVPGGEEV